MIARMKDSKVTEEERKEQEQKQIKEEIIARKNEYEAARLLRRAHKLEEMEMIREEQEVNK